MLLNSGLLWDVEHFIAFGLGVVAGPFLAGRAPGHAAGPLRRGARSGRSSPSIVAVLGDHRRSSRACSPATAGRSTATSPPTTRRGLTLALVIGAVLQLAAADGLRRGRRLAWVFVTVLLALSLVVAARRRRQRRAQRRPGPRRRAAAAPARRRSGRSAPVRTAGRSATPVGACCGSPAACSSTPRSGSPCCRTTSCPAAKPADMLAEFFSRLVFTTSGNIEPVTTPAKWFVNSIGAVWLVAIARHRASGCCTPAAGRARCPTPTPGCAALLRQHAPRTSSGC